MAADPSPEPETSHRDGPIALAIAALVAATVLVGALAPASGRKASPAPADDPACAEWSDGCRVCRRLPDGPACSTPGIACTPGAQECQSRAAAP